MSEYRDLLIPRQIPLLSSTLNEIYVQSRVRYDPLDFEILSVTQDATTGANRWVVEAALTGVIHLRIYHYIDGVGGDSALIYEVNTENNANTLVRTVQVLDPTSTPTHPKYIDQVVTEPMVTHVVRRRFDQGSLSEAIVTALTEAKLIVAQIAAGAFIPKDAIVSDTGIYFKTHTGDSIIHTGDSHADHTP